MVNGSVLMLEEPWPVAAPPRSHELADIKSDSAPQALRLNVGPARAQLLQAQLYFDQLSLNLCLVGHCFAWQYSGLLCHMLFQYR